MLTPGSRLNGQYQLIRQLGQGGFGETWEILVNGQTKVLKILLEDFPKAVELFQREAHVLSQLDHPGIPKADANSYFCCDVDGQSSPIHGYIMEKVSGVTLSQWMKAQNYQPVSPLKTLIWLTQLTQILNYLHQYGFLHRDIKPSNIMLKEDDTLVLIDFGGVKAAAATHLQNHLGDLTGTRIASQGYTPTEQMEGQAVAQSDFFALGRTCVYLLTGKHPSEFSSILGKLIWQESSSTLQPELVAFIEELMAPFPSQRPQNTQVILDQLPLIQRVVKQSEKPPTEQLSVFQRISNYCYQPSTIPISKRLRIAGLSSLLTSTVLLSLRFVGALQPLELGTYDAFFRLRPLEAPDERLVLVTISDADLRFQDKQGFSRRNAEQSIAYDEALEQLINTLSTYQPRAIGLDIYLDWMETEDSKALIQSLQSPDKLITACQAGKNEIPPLKHADIEKVGFTNFLSDTDGLVRRHLLLGRFGGLGDCQTPYALSLQLASKYLEAEKISGRFTEEGYLAFDDLTLKNLTRRISGYQNLETDVGQILLNYRSTRTLRAIAPAFSLEDILTQDIQPTDIQDRIVLVGVDRIDSLDPKGVRRLDSWQTPFNVEVPGVFVHAHMTSQLISAVLDARPIIQTLSQPVEGILILSIAIYGSSIVILSLRRQVKLLIYSLTLVLCLGTAFILFLKGWWLPVIPFVLALVGAGGMSAISTSSKSIKNLI
ncbi:MAG: CHASE2 domain-containing protein [Leptolyngbya sp. SIO3F4]|nr:CHASE2 domain-containing protein [Leptolyngbya sp. SIO3F4]